MSLKEAFTIFKERYPNHTMGFTSFTMLRPKHCKLLDSKGTHNVCVCTIHENVKLMLKSIKAINQEEIMDKLLCNSAERTDQCFYRVCGMCPNKEEVQEHLSTLLEENCNDEMVFQQWLTVDHCDLETIIKPTDEFVPFFIDKIDKLITHDFICQK